MATDKALDWLRVLVEIESPSADPAAVTRCADAVVDLAGETAGLTVPERIVVDGRTHLRWANGPTRVVLVGHIDTVWPLGTIDRWPFTVDDTRASGPGAFDMKAGIVQLFVALAELDHRTGVTVLLTADEEIGSPSSRALIEDTARGARAALILEPSAGSALKIGRKGVSNYELVVHGRAAHAGLEPEKGANATVAMARHTLALGPMARPSDGTTVTPTVVHGGTATNVVPAEARLMVDVRATTVAEQERVDREVRALASADVEGTTLDVLGGANRPPLEAAASAELFALAQQCAADIGLPTLTGVEVGGGSDGNFTAALGVPTLDGLGAVGDGAHAEGEWVDVTQMQPRASLLAAMLRQLLA